MKNSLRLMAGPRRIILVLVATAILSISISAAWGDLDLSFGTFGVYTDSGGGFRVADIYVQPDGKILVTGYTEVTTNGSTRKRIALRRYGANGGRDTTFGNNGVATNNSLIAVNADYQGKKITVLSNGTIVVVGSGNGSAMTWTFSATGTLSYSRTLSDFTTSAEIVSIGNTAYMSGLRNGDVRLIRLTSQGAKDTSYNGGVGHSLTPFGPGNTTHALLAEADTGKLTIAGILANGSLALDRKYASGADDGSLTPYLPDVNPGPIEIYPYLPFDLVRQNDGHYLVGYSRVVPSSVWDGRLSRFAMDGSFVDRRGGSIVGNVEFLGLQSNGRVILGGYYRYYRWDSQFTTSEYFDSYAGTIDNLIDRTAAFTATDKIIIAGRDTDTGALKLIRLLTN